MCVSVRTCVQVLLSGHWRLSIAGVKAANTSLTAEACFVPPNCPTHLYCYVPLNQSINQSRDFGKRCELTTERRSAESWQFQLSTTLAHYIQNVSLDNTIKGSMIVRVEL